MRTFLIFVHLCRRWGLDKVPTAYLDQLCNTYRIKLLELQTLDLIQLLSTKVVWSHRGCGNNFPPGVCKCEHAGMWSSKTCKNFLSITKFKFSILRIWDLAHSAWCCAVHTSVVFFSVWVNVLVIAYGWVGATSVCDKKLDRKLKLIRTNTPSVVQQLDRKKMEVRGEFDQPVFVPKAALMRRQGLVNPRGPLVQEPFGSASLNTIFGMMEWCSQTQIFEKIILMITV